MYITRGKCSIQSGMSNTAHEKRRTFQMTVGLMLMMIVIISIMLTTMLAIVVLVLLMVIYDDGDYGNDSMVVGTVPIHVMIQ